MFLSLKVFKHLTKSICLSNKGDQAERNEIGLYSFNLYFVAVGITLERDLRLLQMVRVLDIIVCG